jgi:branched-chain amino acid aminotransferase
LSTIKGAMNNQIYYANFEDVIFLNEDIREDLLLQKGIYDVVRFVRKDAALYLTAHLERFVNSAKLENIELPYSMLKIKNLLKNCLGQINYEEFRVKLFFICGSEKIAKGLYFVFEDLSETMKKINIQRNNGVALGSYQLERLIPESKSIEWLKLRVEIKNQFLKEFDEGLILNEGCEILEGLSSNFFFIQNGKVFTADKGVLNGVTRQILLEKMDVNTGFLKIGEISYIDEAFITSTSRGVLPVRSIDGVVIGNEEHPKAMWIAKQYEVWLEDYLEIIEI